MLQNTILRRYNFAASKRRKEVIVAATSRTYATHQPRIPSSLLSQSLDQKQRSGEGASTVGPFQLGLAQPAVGSDKKVRKWSELSTGGKVMRTTARTSNLTVILLGAGLSAVLVYSLTSELFSKNSPTVLYGDACDRIKASPKVARYLNAPYSFHNNPPSAVRPRHRNRHVSSQVMVDSTGREHMIMSFYVQGSSYHSPEISPESSYLGSLTHWVKERAAVLAELKLDESIAWSKQYASDIWDRSKDVFKYVSGAPVRQLPALPAPTSDTQESYKKGESTAWSFAGMFSGLRGKRPAAETTPETNGHTWKDGEVHADFVRNDEGYFVLRYLLIDIPNSRTRNPVRIFVERSAGVRENEPVVRWDS